MYWHFSSFPNTEVARVIVQYLSKYFMMLVVMVVVGFLEEFSVHAVVILVTQPKKNVNSM